MNQSINCPAQNLPGYLIQERLADRHRCRDLCPCRPVLLPQQRLQLDDEVYKRNGLSFADVFVFANVFCHTSDCYGPKTLMEVKIQILLYIAELTSDLKFYASLVRIVSVHFLFCY
jgi:hypothetical protein